LSAAQRSIRLRQVTDRTRIGRRTLTWFVRSIDGFIRSHRIVQQLGHAPGSRRSIGHQQKCVYWVYIMHIAFDRAALAPRPHRGTRHKPVACLAQRVLARRALVAVRVRHGRARRALVRLPVVLLCSSAISPHHRSCPVPHQRNTHRRLPTHGSPTPSRRMHVAADLFVSVRCGARGRAVAATSG